MSRFSDAAWQRNLTLYETIKNMPFNAELAAGTLAPESFKHYMIQDAHYLIAFGRALAVAGAKAFSAEELMQFCEAAKVAVIVERHLHHDFMKLYQVSEADFLATPLSPACHHYTSYLLATAWAESYPIALAALLPCFWIYGEIGKDIYQRSAPNNPYQAWIDTYAGEEFHTAVNGVITTLDRIAESVDSNTLEKMHHAFTYATKLEWYFWDSAYHQKNWAL